MPVTIRYTKKSDANNRIVITVTDFSIDTKDSGDVSIVQGIINAASELGLLSVDLQVQFSADGIAWHDTYANGDSYMRFSMDGESWGSAIPIKQDMTGVFEKLTAGDITPDVEEAIDVAELFAMQSTGGPEDIMTGAAEFVSVRGNLDDNLTPFNADQFVSTGQNLVNTEQYITTDSKKGYYFPVAKGEWGSYGTSDKNNGYIIICDTTKIVGVYFSTTKPTNSSFGSSCTTDTDHSKTFYLPPSDGWLTIVMQDTTVPACHIVWNSEKDTEAGEFGNTVKTISLPHAWGAAALFGPEYSVFDETNYRDAKKYPRIDRINLGEIAAASWDATTETVDENTTYIYKYTLPTASATKMKPGGLWRSNYNGIVVDHENGKLVITSTTITTAADLVTALSGKMFYYELNTVTPVSISGAADILANKVDNFGLSYFLLNGELVGVEAFVTEAFYQTGKGQLFDGLARMAMIEAVMAHTMNVLHKRVSGIDDSLRNNLVELLVMSSKGKKRQLSNLVGLFKLKGSGSPISNGIVPDFVGQEYYDTSTNKKKYEAFGVSSASDWELMN